MEGVARKRPGNMCLLRARNDSFSFGWKDLCGFLLRATWSARFNPVHFLHPVVHWRVPVFFDSLGMVLCASVWLLAVRQW